MQNKRVLTIKELNKYIKMKLESDMLLQEVWVRGEISNFTHHSSGHMYFTIKDKDSRLKCVMFAGQNRHLAFIPKAGAKVLAAGNVSVYERDGQYQFYVSQMQPDGIGSLFLAYEQLKQKLEQEGLFAAHNKKQIPKHPKAVGVITSATGAAVRDIVITLQRRNPSVPILIYPVTVQGTSAAPSIVQAIEAMNRLQEVDVLIVGRGGGSIEELWAFNDENVARSIHASDIPIISAVGHETDYTIADFTADIRAATPTAAAELAVPHHLELKQQLSYFKQRLQQSLTSLLLVKQEQLARIQRSTTLVHPQKHLLEPTQRLDRLKEQLLYRMKARFSQMKERSIQLDHSLSRYNPQEQLNEYGRRLITLRHQLIQSIQGVHRSYRYQYHTHIRQLDALSPLKVMQRGYSLVYDKEQEQLIKSIHQLKTGDQLHIKLADGQVNCDVKSLKEGQSYARGEA